MDIDPKDIYFLKKGGMGGGGWGLFVQKSTSGNGSHLSMKSIERYVIQKLVDLKKEKS